MNSSLNSYIYTPNWGSCEVRGRKEWRKPRGLDTFDYILAASDRRFDLSLRRLLPTVMVTLSLIPILPFPQRWTCQTPFSWLLRVTSICMFVYFTTPKCRDDLRRYEFSGQKSHLRGIVLQIMLTLRYVIIYGIFI